MNYPNVDSMYFVLEEYSKHYLWIILGLCTSVCRFCGYLLYQIWGELCSFSVKCTLSFCLLISDIRKILVLSMRNFCRKLLLISVEFGFGYNSSSAKSTVVFSLAAVSPSKHNTPSHLYWVIKCHFHRQSLLFWLQCLKLLFCAS